MIVFALTGRTRQKAGRPIPVQSQPPKSSAALSEADLASNWSFGGVAGNKRRVPKQPSWAFIDDKLTWDHPSNLSGIVGHGNQFPCPVSSYGAPGQMCKLLDGVFLSAKSSTLRKHGVQFDERFDFHFYDLDFCRQAELKNLRLGTIPIGLIHQSGGNFSSNQWKAGYARYLDKWGE